MLPAVQPAVQKKHSFRTYYYGNFALRVRQRARELARRSGQSRRHHLAHLRSSPALRQQLRRPAQPPRDSVRGVQLSRFPRPRARDRSVRRGTAPRRRRQRDAIDGADRAARRRDRAACEETRRAMGVEFRELRALCRRRSTSSSATSTKTPNPRSGREMLVMSGQAVPVRMKDYGIVRTRRARLPCRAAGSSRAPHVESGRYAAAHRSPALARAAVQTRRGARRSATSSASSIDVVDEGRAHVPGPQRGAAQGHGTKRRSCPRRRARSSSPPRSRWRGWRSICSSRRATTAWSRGT